MIPNTLAALLGRAGCSEYDGASYETEEDRDHREAEDRDKQSR